ncbi:Inner membrane protein ydcO [Serratia fonticola]|uniref:Inner membrane protein ydcO n=1 Tax=Serratia fonticola TaxID=47917 RepID=A0A4U9WHX5_SERFO|nr:Inner membrane protein ydcO [Serratia fonticola]
MLFSALPVTLIHTIAGLALLGTIAGSLQRALQDDKQRDAAVITFLITASGLTLLNVGGCVLGADWRCTGIRYFLITTAQNALNPAIGSQRLAG